MISWILGAAVAATAATASSSSGEYVEVKVCGRLRTGIMAIGGETTGYTISARGLTWELDFGADEAQKSRANAQNGRRIVVTGTLEVRSGVERPQRTIVEVRTLSPADASGSAEPPR